MRWQAFADACFQAGILPGVWFTEGAHIADAPADAGFAIAECEGPADYDGIMLAIKHAMLPPCPLALATNFNLPLVDAWGVPQPDAAAPLIEVGFECLTEAYMGDNPNAMPDALDFRARQLGWRRSAPIFARYNAPAETYAPWAQWPGSSDYLAENVLT